ncbi:hypothetical protein RvY_04676 [Ramazzottius varieornatus]|uniref:RING-type domain-containing protein n=1 Tax=Ramazzottius varieornatus TaxID=947166 RepID=A0A1D1UT24_RAMVA|nr:hypothetical protein RvY_04676 [Ramazzottius varieornatus]
MNPSFVSPANSPAPSSPYQDYLDELVPSSGRGDFADLMVAVDGVIAATVRSHPSSVRDPSSLPYSLPAYQAMQAAARDLSNHSDLTAAAFEGSPLDNSSTSAGRPLDTFEGPAGRSSSPEPLSELFSPATPPEGSSQQQQQQTPPDYAANHLARFARIHSFMEARRRESESSAATAGTRGSRGQSPARLSTASPIRSQLGIVPAELDSVPPNVNPFMGLNRGQSRPSVIRRSPPQSSGSAMPSVEPGQRQPSGVPPRRDREVVDWEDGTVDLLGRQEGLQRRLIAMQRDQQARNRSQMAIEEYLRNMRSGQRVQAFPPYQPPYSTTRQTSDGVTYVSQNPVYVSHLEYPPAPVTNSPASSSPAQPSSEAGPSRSLSTRMSSSSPLVSVLHTNPGQVLSVDRTLPMHRRVRQTIPNLGPQHTAYTPSAEVYADRAVAVAASPLTSSEPMEVEGSLYEVGIRLTHQASQQNQAQGTQTDRMPRFRRILHPVGSSSVLTEEETRLSAAERISRRRSERVASTPYDRLSAYTQTFTDRGSIQQAQPLSHHVETITPFMAGIPDYGTLREPSSNTWRQERETRMQADMQQRINAEMHVRERVRAAVEAREFPRSTSHVTVAGERLSVDQQIPTRHTGVSRDLNPYYQQIRNDQEGNAERRRRLYYIPQNPAVPPSVGVHYHRLPASLLHFMESGAIFMHHDGEPKLILEQDVISAIAVDTQSFKFDNQFAATEECIICFDEFALQQEVRVLSCNSTHRFHKECIDKWLIKNKPNCPICRRILPSLNQPKEPVVNMEQEAGPSHTHGGHSVRPSSSTEASEGFPLLPDLLADYV